jgi:hypothetical protein
MGSSPIFSSYASAAQVVEQLLRKQKIAGSNPVIGSRRWIGAKRLPDLQLGVVWDW